MITQKDVDIFGAVFEFYKKYHSAPDWESLIRESDELSAKYKSGFLDQLILVCVDDIDRRYMASINKPWKSDPLSLVYERLKNRVAK